MDILDFSENLKNFRHNGNNLNLDERMRLEIALTTLQSEINCDELLFWGKICGIEQDYYVAVSLTLKGQYEFPLKKFYWAVSKDFVFQDMPDLNEQHREAVDRNNELFMGDPRKVLVNVENKEEGEEEEAAQEEPEEGEEGEGAKDNQSDKTEEEEIQVPPKNLREVDRLAYVVRAIEDNCQIVPLGAFKMTPHHEVCRNESFQGLSQAQSLCLDSYQHFRNVQAEPKKQALDEPNAPFNAHFLESVTQDKPVGQWSAQQDQSGKRTLVRSLLWPGYSLVLQQGKKKFDALYIGDGLKNHELAFML